MEVAFCVSRLARVTTRLAKATTLGQVFTGTFNLTSIFLEDFAGFLQGFRFTLPVAIPAGTDLP